MKVVLMCLSAIVLTIAPSYAQPLPGSSSPSGLGPPVVTTLSNDAATFTFDTATGSIATMGASGDAPTFSIENSYPWRVNFRSINYPYSISSLIAPATTPVETTFSVGASNYVRYAWFEVLDAQNSFVVALTYELQPGADYLRVTLAVDSDGVDRYGVGAPILTDRAVREGRIYVSPRQELGVTQRWGLIENRRITGIRNPAVTLTQANSRVIPGGLGCGGGACAGSTFWEADGLFDFFPRHQVTAAYWNAAGHGLYVYPERQQGFNPTKSAYLSRSTATHAIFQITHVERYPDDLSQSRSTNYHRPVRVGLFKSAWAGELGWFGFARHYKNYLEQETLLLDPLAGKIAQRSDIPQDVKDGSLVFDWFGNDNTNPFDPTNPAWRSALTSLHSQSATYIGASLKMPAFFIGWQQYQSSASFTTWTPQPGMSNLFQEMQASGNVAPFLYTLSHGIAQNDPQVVSFFFDLVRDAPGTASNEHLATEGPNMLPNYRFNATTGSWLGYVEPNLTPLVADGARVFYFDAAYPDLEDYHPTHGHVRGPGAYQNADVAMGLQAVRDALRLTDPDVLTTSEDFTECAFRFQDLSGGDGLPSVLSTAFKPALMSNFIGGDYDYYSVLFNSAVYHEYAPMFAPYLPEVLFVGGSSLNAYEYFSAKSALEGGNIVTYMELNRLFAPPDDVTCIPYAWSYPNHTSVTLCTYAGYPDAQAALQNYADLTQEMVSYRAGSKYLVDGEWWPRVLSTGIDSVTQKFADAITGEIIDLPVSRIVNSVWRAQDGDFGIFFANPQDAAHGFSFTFPATRYALPPGTTLDLYVTDSAGVRTHVTTGVGSVSNGIASMAGHSIAHYEVVATP